MITATLIDNRTIIKIKEDNDTIKWTKITSLSGISTSLMSKILTNERRLTLETARKLLPILQRFGLAEGLTPEDLEGASD